MKYNKVPANSPSPPSSPSPAMGAPTSITPGVNQVADSMAVTSVTPFKPKAAPSPDKVVTAGLGAKATGFFNFFTASPARKEMKDLTRELVEDIIPRMSDATVMRNAAQDGLDRAIISRSVADTALKQRKSIAEAHLRIAERDKQRVADSLKALSQQVDYSNSMLGASAAIPAVAGTAYSLKEGSYREDPFTNVLRKKFASLIAHDSPLRNPEGAAAAGVGAYGGYLASGVTSPVTNFAADVSTNRLLGRIDSLSEPGSSRAHTREIDAILKGQGISPIKRNLAGSPKLPIEQQKALIKSQLLRRYGRSGAILTALLGSGLALGMYDSNKMKRRRQGGGLGYGLPV